LEHKIEFEVKEFDRDLDKIKISLRNHAAELTGLKLTVEKL